MELAVMLPVCFSSSLTLSKSTFSPLKTSPVIFVSGEDPYIGTKRLGTVPSKLLELASSNHVNTDKFRSKVFTLFRSLTLEAESSKRTLIQTQFEGHPITAHYVKNPNPDRRYLTCDTFKIKIDGKATYALKLFKNCTDPSHTIRPMVKNAFRYTASSDPNKRAKDVIDIHMAEIFSVQAPSKYYGWALYSWREEDGYQQEPQRPRGPRSRTLEEILYSEGNTFSDYRRDNVIGGSICDLGGIKTREEYHLWMLELKEKNRNDFFEVKHSTIGLHHPNSHRKPVYVPINVEATKYNSKAA